eukprot:TRINITY_DN1851_c0_g2_i1.p1 TRINITY_DN1851_c0_g2~~TRINITY_DN1851_c0_g2_i1.p1  ORF type:complete len:898 (-),score=241.23 TRINITY_DN1851_c0_g2_i1:8-2701(-)
MDSLNEGNMNVEIIGIQADIGDLEDWNDDFILASEQQINELSLQPNTKSIMLGDNNRFVPVTISSIFTDILYQVEEYIKTLNEYDLERITQNHINFDYEQLSSNDLIEFCSIEDLSSSGARQLQQLKWNLAILHKEDDYHAIAETAFRMSNYYFEQSDFDEGFKCLNDCIDSLESVEGKEGHLALIFVLLTAARMLSHFGFQSHCGLARWDLLERAIDLATNYCREWLPIIYGLSSALSSDTTEAAKESIFALEAYLYNLKNNLTPALIRGFEDWANILGFYWSLLEYIVRPASLLINMGLDSSLEPCQISIRILNYLQLSNTQTQLKDKLKHSVAIKETELKEVVNRNEWNGDNSLDWDIEFGFDQADVMDLDIQFLLGQNNEEEDVIGDTFQFWQIPQIEINQIKTKLLSQPIFLDGSSDYVLNPVRNSLIINEERLIVEEFQTSSSSQFLHRIKQFAMISLPINQQEIIPTRGSAAWALYFEKRALFFFDKKRDSLLLTTIELFVEQLQELSNLKYPTKDEIKERFLIIQSGIEMLKRLYIINIKNKGRVLKFLKIYEKFFPFYKNFLNLFTIQLFLHECLLMHTHDNELDIAMVNQINQILLPFDTIKALPDRVAYCLLISYFHFYDFGISPLTFQTNEFYLNRLFERQINTDSIFLKNKITLIFDLHRIDLRQEIIETLCDNELQFTVPSNVKPYLYLASGMYLLQKKKYILAERYLTTSVVSVDLSIENASLSCLILLIYGYINVFNGHVIFAEESFISALKLCGKRHWNDWKRNIGLYMGRILLKLREYSLSKKFFIDIYLSEVDMKLKRQILAKLLEAAWIDGNFVHLEKIIIIFFDFFSNQQKFENFQYFEYFDIELYILFIKFILKSKLIGILEPIFLTFSVNESKI